MKCLICGWEDSDWEELSINSYSGDSTDVTE